MRQGKCYLPEPEFTHFFFNENKLILSIINNFPICALQMGLHLSHSRTSTKSISEIQYKIVLLPPPLAPSQQPPSPGRWFPPPLSAPWHPANTMPNHPCHLYLVSNPVPSDMTDYSLFFFPKKEHRISMLASRKPGQTNVVRDQRGGGSLPCGRFLTFHPIKLETDRFLGYLFLPDQKKKKNASTPSLPPPGLSRNAAEAHCGSSSSASCVSILSWGFLTPHSSQSTKSSLLNPISVLPIGNPAQRDRESMWHFNTMPVTCHFLTENWELFWIQVLWFSIISRKLKIFKKSKISPFLWNKNNNNKKKPTAKTKTIKKSSYPQFLMKTFWSTSVISCLLQSVR